MQTGKVELPLPLMTPCIVFPVDFETTEVIHHRYTLDFSSESVALHHLLCCTMAILKTHRCAAICCTTP